MLRIIYFLTCFCCVLPTFFGLFAVGLASFSFIPSLTLLNFNWQGFQGVFAWNGFEQSIALTLFSSLVSTYLACFISFAVLQSCWGSAFWKKVQWMLSPLLSLPHVAFAIGFAFLFAPTGLGVRLIQHLTGVAFNEGSLPLLIQDPFAIGLTLMLAVKEVPFLLFMSMTVLQQIDVTTLEKTSASLGYTREQAWWKVILPLWFGKMRFALFAVMAYGLSVVDVAMILGPSNPPTFAVLIWQWFTEPDLSQFPKAAAGAALMLMLAISLMGFVGFIEWFMLSFCRNWQISGRNFFKLPGKALFVVIASTTALILPLMVTWSLVKRWRFPDLFPSQFSLHFWQEEWGNLFSTIEQSLFIAIIVATLALIMAIVVHEYRLNHRLSLPNMLIAIPMLIPQLSILLGIQVAILYFDVTAYFFWVIWAHVFFAFPYVYLSLDGAWRSYDMRFSRCALSLGKSPLRVWFTIKLPLLLPAVIFAWAIGVSVSLAQYLPTLMLGAGRVATLTTEAVALASGFDRRVTAIYALWQALLPLLFFFFAILVHYWQGKYRRINLKGFIKYDTYPQGSHHL